jgi:hypothetical protein
MYDTDERWHFSSSREHRPYYALSLGCVGARAWYRYHSNPHGVCVSACDGVNADCGHHLWNQVIHKIFNGAVIIPVVSSRET